MVENELVNFKRGNENSCPTTELCRQRPRERDCRTSEQRVHPSGWILAFVSRK